MKFVKKALTFIAVILIFKAVFYFFYKVNRYDNKNLLTESSSVQTSHTERTTSSALPAPGYHRYVIGYDISVELPEKWSLLSHTEISEIKNKSATIAGSPSSTTLAANANKDAKLNDGIFRVSITDANFTSDDLKSASPAELDSVCKEISNNMKVSLPKIGARLANEAKCSISKISGKDAFLINYQRINAGSNTVWDVSIYQVPINGKSFIFTASRSTDARKETIEEQEHILNSIKWD
ncbi:TPA: hypothetical protein NWA15_002452 [Escherichia coli]|nr:hypothetical protein [Escherichia coli]